MRSIHTAFSQSFAVVSIMALSLACGRQPATSQDAKVARQQEELVALEAKRQASAQRLKSLQVRQLAQQLAEDSARGVEPFNSMAFTELVSRGETAGAPLKDALETPDGSSLLGLLALRRVSPSMYKGLEARLRTKVLLDSLRDASFFNLWGLPHVAWEEAATALIEQQRSVEIGLVALLDDKREAKVWGSEGASEAHRFRYRVCDYAWALLNEVRGTPIPIPEDPAERDKLIEAAKH